MLERRGPGDVHGHRATPGTERHPEEDEYETLGHFYAALEAGLDHLEADSDLFAHHQPERQLSDPSFYGPVMFDAEDSGGLMLIHDRDSAREALEIIIHQGEGVSDERWADPDHRELTHYYKFEQIAEGGSAVGPVWPVVDNPRTENLPERLQGVSNLFNALYRLLFITMEDLFSGSGDQGALVGRLYALMSDCLAPTARYLVRQPVKDDRTAGPTFEAYRFGPDPWTEAVQLARAASIEHSELAGVASSVSGLTAF
jgi:hypothetical protein